MKPELLTSILARASTEELGLVISTNNPKQLQILLSNHNRELPSHFDVSIAIPSTPDTLFVVKKTVELDEALP